MVEPSQTLQNAIINVFTALLGELMEGCITHQLVIDVEQIILNNT